MQEIVAGFKAPDSIQSKGFHIAGDKMFTLKADDRSIYGKQVCLDLFFCWEVPLECSSVDMKDMTETVQLLTKQNRAKQVSVS